jgi:hypothetical protein
MIACRSLAADRLSGAARAGDAKAVAISAIIKMPRIRGFMKMPPLRIGPPVAAVSMSILFAIAPILARRSARNGTKTSAERGLALEPDEVADLADATPRGD